MRLVINIILFLALLLVGTIAFMPKDRLYYYGEKMLQDYKLIISGEKIKETLIDLRVTDGIISYEGADIAKFDTIKVRPLILVNSIDVFNIELQGLAKSFSDLTIDELRVEENILKPKLIKIKALGSFGKAEGWADLSKQIVHVDIVESKNIDPIRKFLKKGEKGWYYESKF